MMRLSRVNVSPIVHAYYPLLPTAVYTPSSMTAYLPSANPDPDPTQRASAVVESSIMLTFFFPVLYDAAAAADRNSLSDGVSQSQQDEQSATPGLVLRGVAPLHRAPGVARAARASIFPSS